MKHNIWWVVALNGAYVGQLYVSKRSAQWSWGDQGGATFHKVKLVAAKTKKLKSPRTWAEAAKRKPIQVKTIT